MKEYDVHIKRCWCNCKAFWENDGYPVAQMSDEQIAEKAKLEGWTLTQLYMTRYGRVVDSWRWGAIPYGIRVVEKFYDSFGQYAGCNRWYFFPKPL